MTEKKRRPTWDRAANKIDDTKSHNTHRLIAQFPILMRHMPLLEMEAMSWAR